MVILTLALREKVDKKAGALFIVLYLLSYAMLRVTYNARDRSKPFILML